jgi:transposase
VEKAINNPNISKENFILDDSQLLVMDNARFHRKKQLRRLARRKVRLLFLPPYSPDYNLIEKSQVLYETLAAG